MTPFTQLQTHLQTQPYTWLVTGVAGFIGSNLLEALLKLNQRVVGLDNFATGHQHNLIEVQGLVSPAQWANFNFILGDIRNLDDCHKAAQGVDYILHQAALGSVPRSVAEAQAVRTWMQAKGLKSVLVVSDPPHLLRVHYAWASNFWRTELAYTLIAATPPWWSPWRWWQNPQAKAFVTSELLKLGYYLVRY